MDVMSLIRKGALHEPLGDEERQAVLRFADDHAAELARLREELESSAVERDRARDELAAIKRRKRVGEIAGETGFLDPGYLDYLMQQRGAAVDDPGACREVLDELRTTSPRLFRIDLNPGGGSIPAPSGGSEASGWDGDLAKLLRQAPEIND